MEFQVYDGSKGVLLKFTVFFKCCVCRREVEPDKFAVGRRHVYATHCGVRQEVGCVA